MRPDSVPTFCGSCGAEVISGISCGGPCGQSFHALCVDVDVACLEAVSTNIGLEWFCMACWPEVQSLMARQDHGEQSENATTPMENTHQEDDAEQFENTEPGPERRLPPEIWEIIFLDMNLRQLLRIRQTCHYWRDIVNGSHALLDRLTVYFPSGIQMDHLYQPENLMPATRVTWYRGTPTKLVCVDAWWPMFGQKLTYLDMKFTSVTLTTLLNMFRCTPNLKDFLSGSIADGSVTTRNIDFRLDRMENMQLEETSAVVVEKLAQICPRVKRFRVDYFELDEDEPILGSVRALQSSLEEIALFGNGNIIPDLCKLERLKLKRIILSFSFYTEDLMEFCRLQPDLELLDVAIYANNEDLCEIGRSCPKLKYIDARITHAEGVVLIPSFLNTISEIERLTVKDYEDYEDPMVINFEGIRNERLTEITLSGLKPVVNSIQVYLKHSPKLTTVDLTACSFDEFADLMEILQAVKSLEKLTLWGIMIENNGPIKSASHKPMDRLKSLIIFESDITSDEIDYLLSLCPVLQEFTQNMPGDFVVSHELESLKKLDLRQNLGTVWSTFCIVYYCRNLEELLVSTGSLTADCHDVLEKVFGSRLRIIVGY